MLVPLLSATRTQVTPSLPGANLEVDAFTEWTRRMRRERELELILYLYGAGDIDFEEMKVLARS